MSFDSSLIMPTQLMVSMLNQAKNGEELLTILDTITAQSESSEYNEPTLEYIDFWYQLSSVLVTLWQLAQGQLQSIWFCPILHLLNWKTPLNQPFINTLIVHIPTIVAMVGGIVF